MKTFGFNLQDLEKSNMDDIIRSDIDREYAEKQKRKTSKKSKKLDFSNILEPDNSLMYDLSHVRGGMF